MPAPDLETIYDFEGNIEPGLVTLLTALSLSAYTQREVSQIVTPYVMVQLAVGASTEHYAAFAGDYRPDVWNSTLQIQVVTSRANTNLSHTAYRAKVRKALAVDADYKNSTTFPYHEIFSVLESGTTPSILTEDNLDVSSLAYSLKFGIRSGAWPV